MTTLKSSSKAEQLSDAWPCPDCGQLVEPARVTDHKGDVFFYKITFCPHCPEGKRKKEDNERSIAQRDWQEKAMLQLKMAGLDEGLYSKFRFATWDKGRQGANAAAVFDALNRYVDRILEEQPGRQWVYLHGPNGNGKTHLAVAALRKIAIKRRDPWRPHLIVWPELCQATKESWTADYGPSEAQLWGKAKAARALLIDDLDKTTSSEWALEKLFALVNARCVTGRPTIITANRSLSELRRAWQRSKLPHVQDTGIAILSRIAGQIWNIVEFEGKDNRWM